MRRHLSAEGRTFLEAPRYAVLATIDPDGTPQLSVVWYELRGDVVMMNTARGRVKDRNMRRDPRVTLCIEEGLEYVSLQGRVEIIDDLDTAQRDIHALAVRYDGPEAAQKQVERQFAREQRVTLLMHIDRVVERL